MTTYNPLGYNFITIPKFDIQFLFWNNSSFMLRDRYMRYFALICFIGGLKFSYSIFRNSYYLLKRFYFQLKGVQIKPDSYCVILGYGDSDSSHQIAEFYGKLGYNLILVNKDDMIRSKTGPINELAKIKGIMIQLMTNEKINNVGYGVLESELKNKNMKVTHIFDTSIMRVILSSDSNVPTTSEMTFNLRDIQDYVNTYNLFFDFIKKFSKETLVYTLNYLDKQESNCTLFYGFKMCLMKSFVEKYSEQNIFILKTVNLYCEKKKRDFNQTDVAYIYKNSENLSVSDFSFTN